MKAVFVTTHFGRGLRIQIHLLTDFKQSLGTLPPAFLMFGGYRNFAIELREFVVQIDAQCQQVPVKAQGIAGSESGGASCADSIDQNHLPLGLANFHGRKEQLNLALIEE